ncbi:MAG: hypothetical protein AB7N65_12860 [Vicinamibacterales bacterium]
MEPIRDYVRLEFSSSDAATAAVRALVGYMASEAGAVEQALRRPRVVVWTDAGPHPYQVLFLSRTGDDILRRLLDAVPTGVRVTAEALPVIRQLIIGVPCDWDTGAGDRRRVGDGVR